MRTKPEAPLQRDRMTAESLDVRRRAINLMRDLVAESSIKRALDGAGLTERRNAWLRTDGRRGVEIVAAELIDLRNAGVTRAAAEQMIALVREVLEDLYETDRPNLQDAELLEIAADQDEDRAQARAHLLGETDLERLERARSLRRQGAASVALARAIEVDVRHRRLGLDQRRIA